MVQGERAGWGWGGGQCVWEWGQGAMARGNNGLSSRHCFSTCIERDWDHAVQFNPCKPPQIWAIQTYGALVATPKLTAVV